GAPGAVAGPAALRRRTGACAPRPAATGRRARFAGAPCTRGGRVLIIGVSTLKVRVTTKDRVGEARRPRGARNHGPASRPSRARARSEGITPSPGGTTSHGQDHRVRRGG